MRRIWLVCLLVVLAGTYAGADRVTYDKTKTAIALPLSTPPTIDGIINLTDELWPYAGGGKDSTESNWQITVNTAGDAEGDVVRGGSVSSGLAPLDSADLSCNIWVGYDKDNLYVAVRVKDSDIQTVNCEAGSANGNTWTDDSVEVFVDGDNSNFPTSDTTGTNKDVVGTGGQFVITANGAYREAEAGNPGFGPTKAWYAQTTPLEDGTGYDAEFRISLKTLGSPKAGDIIGFTIAVNDADADVESKQVIWVGKTHTEATYGNLVFGPRTYTAVKTTKVPTTDGKISASEYAGANTIAIDGYTGYYDTASGDDSWQIVADTNGTGVDHSYKGWITHDDNAIYLAFDITDDAIVTDTAAPADEADGEGATTWEDDAVEIFFDINNDKSLIATNSDLSVHPQYEGQYVITPNGAHRDNEASNPAFGKTADWYGAATTTATGAQIEFRINKSLFQNPKDDTSVGFNISYDDDDGAGRKCMLMWQGRAHIEASYGTLVLKGAGTAVSEWSLF